MNITDTAVRDTHLHEAPRLSRCGELPIGSQGFEDSFEWSGIQNFRIKSPAGVNLGEKRSLCALEPRPPDQATDPGTKAGAETMTT